MNFFLGTGRIFHRFVKFGSSERLSLFIKRRWLKYPLILMLAIIRFKADELWFQRS